MLEFDYYATDGCEGERVIDKTKYHRSRRLP
jgi:hypothetical protein